MLDRLKRRWLALFRKEEMERELEAELRFHLEREAEQNLRSGMNPEDAHYAALKSFGPVERSKGNAATRAAYAYSRSFCKTCATARDCWRRIPASP